MERACCRNYLPNDKIQGQLQDCTCERPRYQIGIMCVYQNYWQNYLHSLVSNVRSNEHKFFNLNTVPMNETELSSFENH